MSGERAPSRKQKRSLATASDFSNFETSGMYERFSEDDIDSDIEDAIYARVYFDAGDESHGRQMGGSVLEPGDPHQSGDSGEGGSTEEADPGGWSISFALSASAASSHGTPSGAPPPKKNSKGKRKAGLASTTGKLKRRGKSESTHLKSTSGSTESSDSNGFVVMDSYTAATEVIDLTGNSVQSKPPGNKSQKLKEKPRKMRGQGLVQGDDKVKAGKGLDSPSREKHRGSKELDSSAAEADIKRLFGQLEEPAVIVLSSDGEASERHKDVPVSAGSSSGSGRSSVESGELVASRERSRVSSDMEVCSNSSVEVIKIEELWKINEKDRLGAAAYERLHGKGDSVGRYYGESNTKCPNCKQRGHSGKNCPWPKRHTVCYLCSGHGHISSTCPKNLCTYCYREKHRGMSCRVPWSSLATVCTRCYMKGHYAAICPDLWRQYHHTTYESYNLVTSDLRHQRRMDKVYCSNCSSKGHFNFECTRTVPRGNPACHFPLIAFYDQNAWPPRDSHSRSIVQQALSGRLQASSTPNTSSVSPGGEGRKRARGEQCGDEKGGKGRKISPPNKRNREASPLSSGRKNRRRNSRAKNKFGETSKEFDEDSVQSQGSLLITIDGRGSNTGHISPPINHVHPPGVRPSLLGTPPIRDFPREPHPSLYHSPMGYSPPVQAPERYTVSPGHRQGAWHYDDPGRNFTTPSQTRDLFSRSLSTGEHHLPPQHYRRHSEHLERYDHRSRQRDSMRPLMATPTYPGGGNANRGNRGRLISNRGFQMSLAAAQNTAPFGGMEGRGSPAEARRYSQGHGR